MQRYRNHNWLIKQIESGKSRAEIAKKCKVSENTIDDWVVHRLKIIPKSHSLPVKNISVKRNTKIMIFGASGFVGQNLCDFLKKKNCHVLPMARTDLDLLDLDSANKAIKFYAPDVLVHLSAFCGGIGLNKENPALMMHRNLQMGLNVLELCRMNRKIKKLIFLGSVCSYPKFPKNIPFVESDLWDGRPEETNEPYGVAKKTIGFALDAYKKQYNLNSAYLIPTNMYGPYDDFSLESSHVIPAMINKVLEAKKTKNEVILWGDGSPSRDFLYVGDCCKAIWLAIKNIEDPIPINIGSGREIKMKKLIDIISNKIGFNGKIIWDKTKPNGQPRRVLNTKRAEKLLKFKTNIDLESGIGKTIRWYKQNLLRQHILGERR